MKTMRTRIIGNNLEVSAVGLGCMGLSHANGAPVPEIEAIHLLQESVNMGYTFFDTAETYGFEADPHHNEKLLGKAFHDMREKLVISTKFGVSFDYTKDSDHPALKLDSTPETIRKSVEGSLQRLQTDYIDLYYQHRIDPNIEPEVVAGVMKELIAEGKIRHWGISMVDEGYLRRAHAVCPVTAVENMYQLLSADESLFPVLEELNIGFVSCCPMAKGLLSGKYKKGDTFEKGDYRNYTIWFKDETFDSNQYVLEELSRIAEEKNATVAQISLAWMINKKDWIIPIPGTRKLSRLKENAEAGDIILSEEEIERIDSLAKIIDK